MNRTTIIGIVAVAVLVIGGGVTYAMVQNGNDMQASDRMAMTKENAMAKDDAMEKEEVMAKNGDAEVMSTHGNYVTLADYNGNKSKYADEKKILFFHASWCPICRSIEKDLMASPDKIPAMTTFIKTDFDNETKLRQKYGVTVQHTFVQINSDGSLVKKWSGTSTNSALSQIQ